ncbi:MULTISPECIES: alpha/beta hydrolase [Glutamicibacter]|uniref:Esterase n=6 Tax=Glutamicibacter arilaitensis TaxID=256701 RepID=A0A2N7S5G8_9MICC|nr:MULTISPECIES: alpha/beta fold hydrolase [Glutamicibacter]PMQ21386.1 esterase [Glutamicibacter arilaitensis]CBT75412.1 putative esterase/lipase [Glutamicibacter arilaitensis Re117]HCH47301.1 esterase [Glutamicibacter sp.]HCJ54580.1 esterase [Glutamicibacter sp.]HCM94695.1 esterase [Glutamicibacter sp.]
MKLDTQDIAPEGRKRSDAVLLIHGFTGSPISMQPWASSLEQAGFDTAIPLLPGHGTQWKDMIGCDYGQWIHATEQAYDLLAQTHERVFAAGLSMGGALALHLATRRNVAGVSLVNPGLVVDSPVAPYTPWLKHVVRSVAPISDDIAKRGVTEGAYPRTPVAAVAQLHSLFAQTRRRLALVDAPVQLFRSTVDNVVSERSVHELVEGLNSGTLAEHHMLLHSKHVATLDYDAEQIFHESARFFAQLAAAEHKPKQERP